MSVEPDQESFQGLLDDAPMGGISKPVREDQKLKANDLMDNYNAWKKEDQKRRARERRLDKQFAEREGKL